MMLCAGGFVGDPTHRDDAAMNGARSLEGGGSCRVQVWWEALRIFQGVLPDGPAARGAVTL